MISPVRREWITITRLAAPVAAAQLGTMAMWVVDMIMVGGVGVEAIGAVSLGRLVILGSLMVTSGIVFGIDPVIAQAHGARNARLLGVTLQRGLVLALAASVPNAALWLFGEPILLAFGQDPALSAAAGRYVAVQIPLVPAYLVFTVLRQYLMGRAIVMPILGVTLVGNAVNVAANYALIYGHWGLPRMEAVGAGIATVVTQGVMLVALAVWIVAGRLHEGGWTGWSQDALRADRLLALLRYGFPVGVQLSLEVWAFLSCTVLAGWLGPAELAAHSVALNLSSIWYMIPLGISLGAVTRVGNLIGEGDPRGAQRAAWVAFALGAAVMLVSAIAFVVGRRALPAWYTTDPAVLDLCAAILPIAAGFQLFDGVQVVGGGILRGMGKTRPAALFNLAGYYLLALPAAWLFAFRGGLGLPGVWWGLLLGLAVIAVALLVWVGVRGPAHVDARIAHLDD